MAEPETFRQCELIQATPTGFRRYVAWLPSVEVKLGRVVRIDGIWGSWKIQSVGQPRERAFIKETKDHGSGTIVEVTEIKK